MFRLIIPITDIENRSFWISNFRHERILSLEDKYTESFRLIEDPILSKPVEISNIRSIQSISSPLRCLDFLIYLSNLIVCLTAHFDATLTQYRLSKVSNLSIALSARHSVLHSLIWIVWCRIRTKTNLDLSPTSKRSSLVCVRMKTVKSPRSALRWHPE